jgi:hypothetical protein
MKRSVLKPIAAGITLALMIFFMPFILVGALMFMFFGFIFFSLFLARKMRRAYAGRMRYMNTDGLRRRNYSFDAETQVIYLSPENYR